jgi:hypothetical protein
MIFFTRETVRQKPHSKIIFHFIVREFTELQRLGSSKNTEGSGEMTQKLEAKTTKNYLQPQKLQWKTSRAMRRSKTEESL